MARLPRVNPIGIPQHVIQRGNNRQVCFASEQDFYGYTGWLKDYSEQYRVDVHAWVLMTNHNIKGSPIRQFVKRWHKKILPLIYGPQS